FYVSNIMTEQGETDEFTAADHLRVIQEHIGKQIIDYAVINSGQIDEERLKRYIEERAVPVRSSSDEIVKMGINIIERDLVSDTEVAWHDADKLARVILETINMNF
ncbi:MAG: 2-phospho-L-lactate transferase CofD family protein, partial [Syntrophomonadaceae bacterium]